ncbi:MAG: isochorismatase family cysteine hydrolase [Actinomycetota bacterium]
MHERVAIPGEYSRDRPIEPRRTALLVIDVQQATWSDTDAQARPAYHRRMRNVVLPNLARLQEACRDAGIEVMFTVIESLTLDGRDRSNDYKASGFHIPKGSPGAKVPGIVAPVGDEIVLPKTSSGLFNSTNFDYLLRNMEIDTVLVTGVLTDQCVDITVRDGADRGFWMTCISDACATETDERHDTALRAFAGYCRTVTTNEALDLIAAAASAAAR